MLGIDTLRILHSEKPEDSDTRSSGSEGRFVLIGTTAESDSETMERKQRMT